MIILDPLIAVAIIALDIYLWMVIIWVILSWLVNFRVINTSNQFVRMVWEFLFRITEPALRPIRRVVPVFGGLDISPIILFLLIIFLQMVLQNVRLQLHGVM